MYRLIGVLVVFSSLVGCTANIGYKFADTLVEWKVNDYVDLNDKQQQSLSEALNEMHRWHAQTQLPLYRNELKILRNKVKERSLTKSDIKAFEKKLWVFWNNVLTKAEAKKNLLAALTLKQRQQLITRLVEAQEERYQRWQEDKKESRILRQLDRVTEVEKDLENIIGSLTQEQDKLLRSWVSQSPELREQWLSYRSSWLTEFEKALLGASIDEERLSSLILDPQRLRSDAFQQQADRSGKLRSEFLWDVYRSLTDKQRSRVVEKADEYIDLIDSLVKDFSD